jgi:hypothetical protein
MGAITRRQPGGRAFYRVRSRRSREWPEHEVDHAREGACRGAIQRDEDGHEGDRSGEQVPADAGPRIEDA